jgi:hypothetical protein
MSHKFHDVAESQVQAASTPFANAACREPSHQNHRRRPVVPSPADSASAQRAAPDYRGPIQSLRSVPMRPSHGDRHDHRPGLPTGCALQATH